MTAVACLRVAVDADRTGIPVVSLGPLVAKFAAAYLESRWLWPRKFAPLTHYSFLLTDPRSDELDVAELARLSDELQIKLFGEADEGQVGLLLFEGPAEAVTAFAALDAATVARALLDPSLLPPGGRLSKIESPDQAAKAAKSDTLAPPRAAGPGWVEQRLIGAVDEVAAPSFDMPQLEGLQGIYFTLRGLFVGDVISSTPGTARTHLTLLEGAEHMPAQPEVFDADCLAAALHYLDGPGVEAMLYLPICYSNIIRATKRADYEKLFESLPPERRPVLAAAVYDVPRDPAFGALSVLRSTLSRYFTNIDLRTPDPGFEVEKLPMQAVNSVTFVLPEGDQRARLVALRRFVERLPLFKQRRIWPAVTNVRNRLELEACVAAQVPFVTGPGVCRLQTAPVGGRMQDIRALPVLAA
ncbi:hypothetical protein [Phenylobacterium sp.]|uniref:hypothetical protein n=1 Tax=Phenylobacterium sp. TaxID=1871053 RepID=UPI002735BDFE|nr:hypothetical protein [Phenylobacterium sp.]MDP3854851.1 hypothetical protein [Phenylobacterium sp.]